jgi:hypothetical protein
VCVYPKKKRKKKKRKKKHKQATSPTNKTVTSLLFMPLEPTPSYVVDPSSIFTGFFYIGACDEPA